MISTAFNTNLTADEYLRYPIQLPQGAIITEIYVEVTDVKFLTNQGHFSAILDRYDGFANILGQPIASTPTSTVTGTLKQWIFDNTLANNTVDNDNYSYMLKIKCKAGLLTNGYIQNIRITYTVTEVD